jgi:DedD protein
MSEEQDTEITLGTGRLLGIFFGLVIVCALFFGLGFSMGRNSVKSTLTMEEQPTSGMPVQNNAGQKVSANTPEKPTPPVETAPASAESTSTASEPSASAATTPATTPVVQAPELSKAAIPSGAYTVQVAAVSKEEDAEALVSALRKKSYPVFIASNATDKLFHVQIGPFTDIKDAESMKTKLTGDGYNPIVKR